MAWSVREGDNKKSLPAEELNQFVTKERSMPETFTQGKGHLFQTFTKEEWDSYHFASEEDLKWFKEAKYGLFFSFGLSALGKVDIGWSRHTHKLPDSGIGSVPDEIYDGWANEFEIKDFDAQKWISLAKKGGMKYVVIITKHHDGFHMWDTAYSEHKITNSPYKKDYIKELIDECHKQDMKVGVYYSQRDWFHPDYEPITQETFEKFGCHSPYKNSPSEKLHITDRHKRYIEYMNNTVMELATKYGKIDVLWWDACYFNGMFEEEMWETRKLEEKVRKVQPHIIINNRGSAPGDYDTPECMIGYFQNYRPWETCMPLGDGWAWTGTGIKSLKTVVNDLVNCACGDGNYLLSIGAMPNGEIDKPEIDRILEVGNWLEKYGESIYQTQGGPYLPNSDFGSTYKDNMAYLHIVNPTTTEFTLPAMDNPVKSFDVLTGDEVLFKEKNNEYHFDLKTNNGIDVIIKLTLEKKI